MHEQHGIRANAVAPGGTLTGIRPGKTSEFGQKRRDSQVADVPIALPEALTASITLLLSDVGVNINGAVLPSDGVDVLVGANRRGETRSRTETPRRRRNGQRTNARVP